MSCRQPSQRDRLRSLLALALCALLATPALPALADSPVPIAAKPVHSARKPYQPGQMHGDQRILHALDRFTFGPRPGDLEAVRAMGLDNWFAQQLHPETLDNADLNARLGQYPAMQLSASDLLYKLPSNAVLRQAIEGKAPVPASEPLHAIYTNAIARYQQNQLLKEQKKQQAAGSASSIAGTSPSPMAAAPAQPMSATTGSGSVTAGQMNSGAMSAITAAGVASDPPPPDKEEIARILALQPAERVARLEAMPQAAFDSLRKTLKGPERKALLAGLDPTQTEIVTALENPQRVINEEIVAQRLTRDIYSNAQLQEVMTDFWLNHFNVFLHKNEESPSYTVAYERDVVRPRALGKFEDLLEATAHSPAMLLYLDNSSSVGPDSPQAERAKTNALRNPNKKPAPEGLNENYARELMELHTLGVNGGYTQADVTEVARVLTGWTVEKPARGGDFKFDPTRHEPGDKKVLGKKIKDQGQDRNGDQGELEGRELLHLLATRPATAKFISRKLAIRFLSDNPPPALVDRMARTFLASDGDIAAVLTTLFHSPELWAPENYRAKVKTPIEFVASAARSANVDIDNMQPLASALHDMGMPLYGAVPPTGYKWDASDWVSTSALVNRMNFALTFAAGKLPGIAVAWNQNASLTSTVDDGSGPRAAAHPPSTPISVPAGTLPAPADEERRLETFLVAGGISDSTRAALLNQFNTQIQTQPVNTPPAPQPVSRPLPVPARPLNAKQAAAAADKQDQLLAGLLLGSPEFQRR
jgi:uncharacterized protein (DUF1800 family)